MNAVSNSAIYLSLGSNQGDTAAHLAAAREAIARVPGFELKRVSSLYFTEPQDKKNQPWFANQVVELLPQVNALPGTGSGMEPVSAPGVLLAALQGIEKLLGRKRDPGDRFGPRSIDIDILLFGNEVMENPQLTLPHPRLCQRAFVLVPLLELAPQLILPSGEAAQDLLQRLAYRQNGKEIFQ